MISYKCRVCVECRGHPQEGFGRSILQRKRENSEKRNIKKR